MKAVKTFTDSYTVYELTSNEKIKTGASGKYMLSPTFTSYALKKDSCELIKDNMDRARYITSIAFCVTLNEAILTYKVRFLETLYRNLRNTIRDAIENVDELDRLFKECGE